MDRRLLIIGAQPDSLGAAIGVYARTVPHWWTSVVTAGNSGYEDVQWDANDQPPSAVLFSGGPFTDVICTLGINKTSMVGHSDFGLNLMNQMWINSTVPLIILEAWLEQMRAYELGNRTVEPYQFAVISSNSAHIARSGSAGYCASKAALSMGVRCLARQVAKEPFVVYGYEPGWINDTPMSAGVVDALGGAQPHRIPSGKGLGKGLLAHRIVNDFSMPFASISGTMIRIDGGEQ